MSVERCVSRRHPALFANLSTHSVLPIVGLTGPCTLQLGLIFLQLTLNSIGLNNTFTENANVFNNG